MNIFLPGRVSYDLHLNGEVRLVWTQVEMELLSKLNASPSFCRNKLPLVRLPVGLLHRIMEAKIGNKKSWITVFLVVLITLS